MGKNWELDPTYVITNGDYDRLQATLNEWWNTFGRAGRRRFFKPVRDGLIVEVGLYAGLRASEVTRLRVKDFCFEPPHLRVLGKGKKVRRVILGPQTRERLDAYVTVFLGVPRDVAQDCLKPLFPGGAQKAVLAGPDKGPWPNLSRTTVWKIFGRFQEAAELERHYRYHDLRHTYATRMYKAAGNDLRLVQGQLGHSQVTTTQIYADFSAEEAAAAAAAVEKGNNANANGRRRPRRERPPKRRNGRRARR